MDKAVCSVIAFQYRNLEQRRIWNSLFATQKKYNSPNRVPEQNSCQIVCGDYINK